MTPELTQFDIYPGDNGKLIKLADEDTVVKTLLRDGKVPVWIDIAVTTVTKQKTVLTLLCAGRYSGDANELYYHKQGMGPLGVKSPILPIDFRDGKKFWLPGTKQRPLNKMNLTILDKVYYGFLCFAHNSQDMKYRYRKGKGFRYIKYTDGAQRTFTLLFSIAAFIVSGILNPKGMKSEINLFISLGSLLMLVLYLELSMSKRKLWRLRREFPNPDKYLGYFGLFLISVIAIALAIKFYVIIPHYKPH